MNFRRRGETRGTGAFVCGADSSFVLRLPEREGESEQREVEGEDSF